MEKNRISTIETFKELGGQHVIVHDSILRFIGIGEDEHDYLYIMWDGRKVSYFVILSRISQIKDKIDSDHYKDMVSTSKLNHFDSIELYSPSTEHAKRINKINSDSLKQEIKDEIETSVKLLADLNWEIN